MPWWSWEKIRRRELPAGVAPAPMARPSLQRKAAPGLPLEQPPALEGLLADCLEHWRRRDAEHRARMEVRDALEEAKRDRDAIEFLALTQRYDRLLAGESDSWMAMAERYRAVAQLIDATLVKLGASPAQRSGILWGFRSDLDFYAAQVVTVPAPQPAA